MEGVEAKAVNSAGFIAAIREDVYKRQIIRNDGNEAPRVQTMAPGVFANLYPSRELMLMAKAPGPVSYTHLSLGCLFADDGWHRNGSDTQFRLLY